MASRRFHIHVETNPTVLDDERDHAAVPKKGVALAHRENCRAEGREYAGRFFDPSCQECEIAFFARNRGVSSYFDASSANRFAVNQLVERGAERVIADDADGNLLF